MILLIDNYDSFTYNLYQYAGSVNPDIKVVRNDMLSPKDIRKLKPSHIIISPGPGYPKDAGICIKAIKQLADEFPILGVCLGHQAICEAFGGEIILSPSGPVHGKKAVIFLDNSCTLFKGLPQSIHVGRYHSLVANQNNLPDEFIVTAKTQDNLIMGVNLKGTNVYGIQFHPESILTEFGMNMIKNFLNL